MLDDGYKPYYYTYETPPLLTTALVRAVLYKTEIPPLLIPKAKGAPVTCSKQVPLFTSVEVCGGSSFLKRPEGWKCQKCGGEVGFGVLLI